MDKKINGVQIATNNKTEASVGITVTYHKLIIKLFKNL